MRDFIDKDEFLIYKNEVLDSEDEEDEEE